MYGLPRSRTLWLSRFLSYGDWECGHDELLHVRSLEDVSSWFSQPNVGTVETAAAPFWRLLPREVKTITVRRPVGEVVDNLVRLGFNPEASDRLMRRLDKKLDQIEARVPGVMRVEFSELATENGCKRVFENCLPYRHDHAWWQTMDALNLQVNMRSMLRYYTAHQPQLLKVAAQAKHKTIAGMKMPSNHEDGFTFQQEPFDSWYEAAKPLFREHMLQTDQGIEDYSRKNLPLLRKLYEMGAIQITTARCNGRMFGYLMAAISPSLDSPDLTSAMHLAFFADKSAQGIGLKLQRASIEALRARGVGEVFFRAGTRGSGPRLGTLYRRLGAQPAGELYSLELEAA